MAKKKTKKAVNDDVLVQDDMPMEDEGYSPVDPSAEDEESYEMGSIKVAGSEEDDDISDFKKASENLNKDEDQDGEADAWVEDDISYTDDDPFLDMEEKFDIDNPYEDDY